MMYIPDDDDTKSKKMFSAVDKISKTMASAIVDLLYIYFIFVSWNAVSFLPHISFHDILWFGATIILIAYMLARVRSRL
jgi:hypothetical protein